MPVTDWMFLNVRERPFDDARVRRAVNLAADRARIAALEGGPEMGVPICQVVPMGFPAHEPRCPYTADPAPGRGWVAPDSELARRLMAASGRRGERVVVTVPPFRRVTGRYFETLLDGLGLRASLEGPRRRSLLGDDLRPGRPDADGLRRLGGRLTSAPRPSSNRTSPALRGAIR